MRTAALQHARSAAWRQRIEDAIERLIELLDKLDGDPDLEAANDDEDCVDEDAAVDDDPCDDTELEASSDQEEGEPACTRDPRYAARLRARRVESHARLSINP